MKHTVLRCRAACTVWVGNLMRRILFLCEWSISDKQQDIHLCVCIYFKLQVRDVGNGKTWSTELGKCRVVLYSSLMIYRQWKNQAIYGFICFKGENLARQHRRDVSDNCRLCRKYPSVSEASTLHQHSLNLCSAQTSPRKQQGICRAPRNLILLRNMHWWIHLSACGITGNSRDVTWLILLYIIFFKHGTCLLLHIICSFLPVWNESESAGWIFVLWCWVQSLFPTAKHLRITVRIFFYQELSHIF